MSLSFILNSIQQIMKSKVIELYLRGESRNEIASKTGISQGAVSNVIASWKSRLATADFESIRELTIMIKKLGITAVECANGLRTNKHLEMLGIRDEEAINFLSIIINRFQQIGIEPQNAPTLCKQILDISKVVSIAEMPAYLEDQKSKKQQLENEIQQLQMQLGQEKQA